jgi:NAD(P)H dehydrogenase (quinone)
MKIIVVLCHPRQDSLTEKTAASFCEGLLKSCSEFDPLDLYQENFDPILRAEDESNDGSLKNYSLEVQSEFNRLNNNEAIVMIFLLWWSMTTMLKSWIDRVWNYVLMYGDVKQNIIKGLMIFLTDASENEIQKKKL